MATRCSIRPWAFALLLAGGLAAPAPAQIGPDTLAVEEDLEAALDDLSDEALDPTAFAERLAALAAAPLDVNEASAEDLAQIPALTPLLARRLVAFRERSGPFGSLQAIRAVEGMSEAVFEEARPYLRVGPEPVATGAGPSVRALRALSQDLRYELIQRITRRLDLGRGYAEALYPGSPERLYTRLRVRHARHLSLNVTLEKDPGEAFRWAPEASTYGYDYVSAHAAVRDVGRLGALVVGDFNVRFGQGLVAWQGGAFGKGRAPVRPIARFGRGLVPYGSTDENRFFRGVGATVQPWPWLDVTAFASQHALDASLTEPDTSTAAGPGAFVVEARSLGRSGLHRLPHEVAAKRALRERAVGGALVVQREWGQVGAVHVRSRLDPPLAAAPEPYRAIGLAGDRAAASSLFGHAFLGETLVFGEAALDADGTAAALAGLQFAAGRGAEGVMLVRHYPPDFQSLHGYAFGERSGVTQNETGFYTALRLQPARAWTVAGYVDHYRFPWLRFGVDRPTAGRDALLVVEHQPRRWLGYYVQVRAETREAGVRWASPRGPVLASVGPETRRSLRLHGDYRFSDALRLRARLEATHARSVDAPDATGTLLYQDVRWRPGRRLQVDARLAHFDADAYAARVYAYENDLLYTFAVPAFSGRGRRAYILLRLEPAAAATLQVKYAVTRFTDADTIGSGLDAVPGGRLREIRLQLRVRL